MNAKIWMIAGGAIMLVSFILAGKAWAHNPYDQSACRNYTKTGYSHGLGHYGTAQVCHVGGGEWRVTSLSGPRDLQLALIENIKNDVFEMGGVKVTLTTNNRKMTYYHGQLVKPAKQTVPVAYVAPRPKIFKEWSNSKQHWKSNPYRR